MRHLPLLLIAVLCLPRAANAQDTPAPLEQVLQAQDRDSHGDLRAVVVLREGAIVAERYYNGVTAETLHDIRSAGKSITALLLGAAVARGQLATTKTVGEYWSEVAGSPAGKVALDDLLTMRSGLAAFDEDEQSPGNEDKLDAASDPAAFVRGVPAATKPGSTYRYNSLGSYIAGRVVENASGTDLEDYAAKVLFAPLGITRWSWGRDVAKHPKGQGNLSPRVAIGAVDRYADSYGYFWYAKTQDIGGQKIAVHFASGNGGNKIYVIPARRLVVSVASSAYGKGYGQRRSEDILKAILQADATQM